MKVFNKSFSVKQKQEMRDEIEKNCVAYVE